MEKEETLLELDYKSGSKIRHFLTSFSINTILIVFFILFSSYKNTSIRYNNHLIKINTYHFKNLLETQINSIDNQLGFDSSYSLHTELYKSVTQFYKNRDYKPVWTEGLFTNNTHTTFLNMLDSSSYFGFPFDYFGVEKIHHLNNNFITGANSNDVLNQKIDLEISTTFAALKFLLYLEHGIVEKDTLDHYTDLITELPKKLNSALTKNNFRDEILSVQPNLVYHKNLLNSLQYFIDLHRSVQYTTPAFIDDKMLAQSLYYTEITKSPVFDSLNTKADALHKLEEEFFLPKDTLLNILSHEVIVSLLEYKYLQACLNINRLRNLKHSDENYLFVNIPEFKLHVIESNKDKETFNVIVGKKKTPTPILSSNIEKVIANPYWTVPRSIVRNEMIYKIRRDSTYLKRNGFFIINNTEEVVDESIIDWSQSDPLGTKYWIRQINSRHNALGQVKFIFPNNHSVYLHDTPSKRLFSRENRTFSHGCVRLENPDKLAQYLTNKYYNQNTENFDKLIAQKERQVIDLSEKVKIHIQYITCSGNENSIVFFDDVYNRDEEEIKAIFLNQIEI